MSWNFTQNYFQSFHPVCDIGCTKFQPQNSTFVFLIFFRNISFLTYCQNMFTWYSIYSMPTFIECYKYAVIRYSWYDFRQPSRNFYNNFFRALSNYFSRNSFKNFAQLWVLQKFLQRISKGVLEGIPGKLGFKIKLLKITIHFLGINKYREEFSSVILNSHELLIKK